MKEIRMKFYRENKGITLIALIVLIIVLLILAGVGIMTLTGDNGVLNRAVAAKQKSEDAGVTEEIRLAVLAAMTNDQYTVDEDILEEALTSAFGEKGTDYKMAGSSSSGWTIEVKAVSYKVTASGNIKKVEQPVEISTLINNTDKTNNPFADKTKAVMDKTTTQTFYIPKDFKLASDSAEEVDNGIVVEDRSGNQFVWVPWPLAIWDGTSAMASSSNTPMVATFRYPDNPSGKTYYKSLELSHANSDEYYDGSGWDQDWSDNEPVLLTGTEGYPCPTTTQINGSEYDNNPVYLKDILGYDDITEFGKQMQEDYDDMVKSALLYRGFYVGRYETGYETVEGDVKIVSKNASINSNVTTADSSKDVTKFWYGLYKTQKDFATSGSIRSSMIWWGQRDAMLNWISKTRGISFSSPIPIIEYKNKYFRPLGHQGSFVSDKQTAL